MSQAGVAAATALTDTTLGLIEGLTQNQWAADSACPGWRVQDVVTHMGVFFNLLADPGLSLPDNPSGTAERLNDATVRERAEWSTGAVADYYRNQAKAGLAALNAFQGEDLRDTRLDMHDLGSYRLAQLSDAVCFDHLVHLTSDLCGARGPLPAVAVPVEAAIDPALDWMLAGLPQMNGAALDPVLSRPIGLHLTGLTDRSFVIARSADQRVAVTETSDLPADVASSAATEFLAWGTTRTAWRSAVTVSGDRAHVAAVLDAIDIV